MKPNFPDYWGVRKKIIGKKTELYVLQEGGDEDNFPDVIEVSFRSGQPVSGIISSGINVKDGSEIYVLQSEGDETLFPEVLDIWFKNGKITKMEVS